MVESIKNMSPNINIPDGSNERLFRLDINEAQAFIESGIMHAGLSKLKAGFSIARYDVCKHQLIFVIAGSLQYKDIDDNLQTANTGDVVLMPLSHQQHYWAEDNVELLWFHLHGMALWSKIETMNICCHNSEWREKIYQAAIGFLDETEQPREDSAEMANYYGLLTCKYIEREINGSLILEKTTEHEKELKELWKTIEEDLTRNWSVQELADCIYVSPAQLHRMVRAITKTSPMQVVRHIRLKKARELLYNTDDSLTAIANKIGYDSAFSLSKAFKRHFAITPMEIRKQK